MKTHIIVTVIVMILGSLLVLIFTQWYEQETGIIPVLFISVVMIFSIANLIYLLIKLMDKNF
jgi:uncharacterized membrane protein YhdT